MHKAVTGGILTGGQARRLQELGPVDKGLVLLQQRPLVAWVAHTLQQCSTGSLLISANQNLASYASYGTVVVDPTELPPFQGPLAGLWALLERCPTDWLMVLPVDTPFIPVALLTELWTAQAFHPTARLFFMQHERAYPLCLLIHRSVLSVLKQDVLAGERRVQHWLLQQHAIAVDMRQHPADYFFNINTPADVKSAQHRALVWGDGLVPPVF